MRRIGLGVTALGVLASFSCATATRIHTKPEGALVYVNGLEAGRTPVVYHNDPGLPRRYHVQVFKEGYETLDFYLDTKLSWLWGYVGFFTMVPYLWAWSLGREYIFNLSPADGAPPPAPHDRAADQHTPAEKDIVL